MVLTPAERSTPTLVLLVVAVVVCCGMGLLHGSTLAMDPVLALGITLAVVLPAAAVPVARAWRSRIRIDDGVVTVIQGFEAPRTVAVQSIPQTISVEPTGEPGRRELLALDEHGGIALRLRADRWGPDVLATMAGVLPLPERCRGLAAQAELAKRFPHLRLGRPARTSLPLLGIFLLLAVNSVFFLIQLVLP